jgi:hypothetical protein
MQPEEDNKEAQVQPSEPKHHADNQDNSDSASSESLNVSNEHNENQHTNTPEDSTKDEALDDEDIKLVETLKRVLDNANDQERPDQTVKDPEDYTIYTFLSEIGIWDGFSNSYFYSGDKNGMILERWKVLGDEYIFYRAYELQKDAAKKIELMKTQEVVLPLYNITKNGKLHTIVSYKGTQTKKAPEDGFELAFGDSAGVGQTARRIRSFRTILNRFVGFENIQGIQEAESYRDNLDIQEFYLVKNADLEKEIHAVLKGPKDRFKERCHKTSKKGVSRKNQ